MCAWEGGEGLYALKARELSLCRVPYFDRVDIGADHILEVRRHGTAVDFGTGAGASHSLRDIENNACEAVFDDPYLLVVGDLS